MKAVTTGETYEARNILFRSLFFNPEIEAFLYRVPSDISEIPTASFDPTASYVALAAGDSINFFNLERDARPFRREIQLELGDISSLAYNHSGSILAVGGADGGVSLLSTSQWTAIFPPTKVSGKAVDRLFFGLTDDRLFAISDCQAFIFTLARGSRRPEAVQIFDAAARNWFEARFQYHVLRNASAGTADGRFLVTGIFTRVNVWDMNAPVRLRVSFDARPPNRYTLMLREVTISPGGDVVAVDMMAASDGIPLNFVVLYTLEKQGTAGGSVSAVRRLTVTTHKNGSIGRTRLAFDCMGRRLLIGDRDSMMHLIEFADLFAMQTDVDHQAGKDEIFLAGATHPGRLFERYGKSIKLQGLAGPIYNPSFSCADNRVLLNVSNRTVVWSASPSPKLSRTLITHEHAPASLDFTENGGALVLGTSNGPIYRWSLPGEAQRIPMEFDLATGRRFMLEDCRRIAVVQGGRLSLRDAFTGTELKDWDVEGWTVLAITFDGAFAAEFNEGVLRLVDLSSPREVWTALLYDEEGMRHPPIRDPGVSFSKDGARVFCHVYGTTELSVWDTASGQCVEVFDKLARRQWDWAPVVSPDGRWIATAARNYSLAVIDTLRRDIPFQLVEVHESICSVVFSPDSASLAIGYEGEEVSIEDSADGMHHPADYGVLIWDLARKRWDASRVVVPSPPRCVAFHPDGDRLAIAMSPERDEQVQVLIWDVGSRLWVQAAQRYVIFHS